MDRRALDGGAGREGAQPLKPCARLAEAREAERTSNAASSYPLVQKVLDRFKGARIVDVRRPKAAPSPAVGETDDEVGYA